MTENLRIIAIQEAAKVNPANLLNTAHSILAFLLGNETPTVKPPKVETPVVEPPKTNAPRRGRPPKARTETPEVETPKAETSKAETSKAETPKAETPKAEVVDKARVVSAISNLLKDNMRDEAIAIMAKYGAKSISDLNPADYAAVIQDAMDASV